MVASAVQLLKAADAKPDLVYKTLVLLGKWSSLVRLSIGTCAAPFFVPVLITKLHGMLLKTVIVGTKHTPFPGTLAFRDLQIHAVLEIDEAPAAVRAILSRSGDHANVMAIAAEVLEHLSTGK